MYTQYNALKIQIYDPYPNKFIKEKILWLRKKNNNDIIKN